LPDTEKNILNLSKRIKYSLNMEQDIRWVQRFDNFEKACKRVFEITESDKTVDDLSDLEREGLIQRFEYTFELAWKTLQDYLMYLGFEFQTGPNTTIQLAFENNILTDHDAWRKMAKARNLTSHTYNENEVSEIAGDIFSTYSLLLKQLYEHLNQRRLETINNKF